MTKQSILKGLIPMEPLSWEQVFAFWRENEGDDSHWGLHARSRGFPEWAAWRMSYASALRLPERAWRCCRVRDPYALVPTFRGGPYRTWKEQFYGDDPHPTFAQIARHPGIWTHEGVLSIAGKFPEETTIIGLICDSGIVIIEGMHRCTAIAFATAACVRIAHDLTIALADARGETLPIIGQSVP
ncbi:MAG: hypothetical protein Q7T01_02300 [bacterium]|nr:hypothetical protein [bacterium]